MKREFELCQFCNEPLLSGEQISPSTFNGKEVHFECGFRQVAGGANHHRRLCHCYGGTLDPDPPGLGARDAARESFKAWQETHADFV